MTQRTLPSTPQALTLTLTRPLTSNYAGRRQLSGVSRPNSFFIRYGLADTVAGVVLVQLVPTVPYVSLVMAAAFANLDPDVEDQARTLGAGPWRRALLVTLPTVAPSLVVSAYFAFLISWSEYILTLLVGGGVVRTLPLLLFAAIGTSDYTAAATLGLLIALPPLTLVALTSRFLTGNSPAVVGFGRL